MRARPSPTSPCSPTPMWPARAASTWAAGREWSGGWRGSGLCPGSCRWTARQILLRVEGRSRVERRGHVTASIARSMNTLDAAYLLARLSLAGLLAVAAMATLRFALAGRPHHPHRLVGVAGGLL